MEKIAVIAVSTGCLDYLELNHTNLFMIRCKMIMGENTYDDFIDITAEQFYRALEEDKSLIPRSSMPSIGSIDATLKTIEDSGYTDVIMISISSALSGTYQTCLMAKNAYQGQLKIHVLDSKNAAISEGFISLEALRLIQERKTVNDVLSYLNRLILSRKQYFMVDSLRLLVKNGRLSNAAGFLGSMLKIKPILQVNDEGKIVPFEKVRTQRKALEKMVELVIEDLKKLDNFVVTYNTSNNTEGFDYVKSRLDEVFPNHRFYAAPITPVIGAHTGLGTVGIAYFNLAC